MISFRQNSAATQFASILIVSLLAGLLHLAWSVHRDASLRRYRADVVAPLTARADVQRLYQQSPFRAIEIELPPGEMHIRYQLRIWVDSTDEDEAIREILHSFLQQFYREPQARFEARLMAAEIEPARLRALRAATQRNLNELLSEDDESRQERIAQLEQELRDLEKQILEKRALYREADRVDQVILSSFMMEATNPLGVPAVLRSCLVTAFVAMLQLLWLWGWREDRPKH
jgi:hypothetical protein